MKTRTNIIRAALAALVILATGPALAQNQGPATNPNTYVKETHGSWEIRCLKRDEGADPCQMYQQLKDSEGTPTAEVNIFPLPPGQQAAAGAVFVTPLETLLQAQVRFQIDSAQGKRYPFAWCTRLGCVARVALTSAEVESMKKGIQGKVTIVPVAAPDQEVGLNMSLSGFTAAFAAMEAHAAQNR